MRRSIVGLSALLLLAASCNYNYYQGRELESKERFEEANLEYQRAYTASPGDDDFKEAYLRTAERTTEELLIRYQRYITEGKMDMAFARLEQAKSLTPDHPVVAQELRKWTRVLVAGKVEFEFESLKKMIPLADKMRLVVRLNTSDPRKTLLATIDNQNQTFAVEDVIYNVSQKDLIFYSINAIGAELQKRNERDSRLIKFVDLRIPFPQDVQGSLSALDTSRKPVEQIYPAGALAQAAAATPWRPQRDLSYRMNLQDNQIQVNSSNGEIDYLPQMLYVNSEDRRIFIDFGVLECSQKRQGGTWTFRRMASPEREYLADLKNNLIFSPYFYFREGAYHFIKAQG
ncbi:MAG: hypothetical protein RRB13_05165 [bacterium]|nr:hypothetical protein [bacterium]